MTRPSVDEAFSALADDLSANYDGGSDEFATPGEPFEPYIARHRPAIEAAIRGAEAGTPFDVERLRRERDDAATEGTDYYAGMVVAYDRILARLAADRKPPQ